MSRRTTDTPEIEQYVRLTRAAALLLAEYEALTREARKILRKTEKKATDKAALADA